MQRVIYKYPINPPNNEEGNLKFITTVEVPIESELLDVVGFKCGIVAYCSHLKHDEDYHLTKKLQFVIIPTGVVVDKDFYSLCTYFKTVITQDNVLHIYKL